MPLTNANVEYNQETLVQFKTFELLSDDEYTSMMGHAEFRRYSSDDFITKIEDQHLDECLFLLHGTVRMALEQNENNTYADIAASHLLSTPLNVTCPMGAALHARNDTTIMAVPSEVYTKVCANTQQPTWANQGTSFRTLLTTILQSIMTESLKVPSLPEVALKIREALDHEDADIDSISQVIQQDPAIASRLIKVASSARYTGSAPVKTLRDTVMRLGLKTTRDLIIALSLTNLFRSEDPILRQMLKDVWLQSVNTAVMASILAEKTEGLSAQTAFLAGLVSNIGAIPIIIESEENRLSEQDSEQIKTCLDLMSGQIGNIVLLAWGFPTDIASVPCEYQKWHLNNSQQANYADVIRICMLQQSTGSELAATRPRLNAIPAWHKFDLGQYSQVTGASFFEEHQQQIDAEVESLIG